jgi:hypothetical protein
MYRPVYIVLGVIIIVVLVVMIYPAKNNSPSKKLPDQAELRRLASIPPKDSPTVVVRHLKDYTNKEVTLRGRFISIQGIDQYYIVGLDKTTASTLAVDFSKSGLDPTKYVTVLSNTGTSGSKGPYTVKGLVKVTDNVPVLVVESVK